MLVIGALYSSVEASLHYSKAEKGEIIKLKKN
jgi:hypothetical protein